MAARGVRSRLRATSGTAAVVAPPWDPDDISGLVARWLASDIAQADGSAVASWVDRIGSFDAAQATGSKQPLYYSAGATHPINSQPVVHLDGSDILVYAGTISTATSGHVFAVMRDHAGTAAALLSTADEASTSRHLYFGTATSDVMRIVQRNADTEDVINGSTARALNTPYLAEWSSTGTAYGMRNNNTVQTLTVAAGADNGDWFGDTSARDNVTIGGLKNTGESLFIQADVAELIVVDGAISAGDRTNLNSYITTTYGLTLA